MTPADQLYKIEIKLTTDGENSHLSKMGSLTADYQLSVKEPSKKLNTKLGGNLDNNSLSLLLQKVPGILCTRCQVNLFLKLSPSLPMDNCCWMISANLNS